MSAISLHFSPGNFRGRNRCNAYGLNSDITHNIKVRAYITDGSYKDTEKIVDSYINFSNPTNLTGKEIDESKIEYIYNNGIVNEDFGGVEVIGNSEGNSIAEFKSNYIFCATSTRCARYNAKIGTKNTIDLSEYESINAVVNCISYKEGNFGMGLFSAEAVDTYINHKKVNSYSSFESNKKSSENSLLNSFSNSCFLSSFTQNAIALDSKDAGIIKQS